VPLRSGRLQVDALATRHGGSFELAASTSPFVEKWNAESLERNHRPGTLFSSGGASLRAP
jgi:hypothetical protein